MSAGNGPCTSIAGDGALVFVDSGWATFHSWASQAYNLTTNQIYALNNFQAAFHTWDASWQAGDGTLSGFIRPTKPTLPTINALDLSGDIPNAPTVAIVPVALDAPPDEPGYLGTPPELNLTVDGPTLDAERPGAAPEMSVPDEPSSPNITEYAAPSLVDISIPSAPTISIEEFDEAAPEFTAAAPDETLDFVESPYVSAFLDAVKTHLTNLMNGQAMPPEVEAALWSRALDRDEQASFIALQQVDEEFAARGFSPEPNGLWANRRLQVRRIGEPDRPGGVGPGPADPGVEDEEGERRDVEGECESLAPDLRVGDRPSRGDDGGREVEGRLEDVEGVEQFALERAPFLPPDPRQPEGLVGPVVPHLVIVGEEEERGA